MGNCQRRIRHALQIENEQKQKICLTHKIELSHICIDENCPQKGTKLCRKCLTLKHKNHEVEEIESFEDDINTNCSELLSLQTSVNHIRNYNIMNTTQRDLMKPFLEMKNLINVNSQRTPVIEESVRLKLERTAYKIYKQQDKYQTKMEDEALETIQNLVAISDNPERQKFIANFKLSSTYNDMINYNLYQSSQQMNYMTQQLSPYKFNYQTFKNVRKNTLVIQKDIKNMKLKASCRINARFAATFFRNSQNESDFYIIDLIDEKVIYFSKHKSQQNADFDYLYKISYLGNYYVCFNFITYVLIKDFSHIIKNSQNVQQKKGSSFIKGIFNHNNSSNEYSHFSQLDKQIKTIKITPKNLVFSVDKIKSGQLCLMEQQSEYFLEVRDYSIWNFKKKQCIRTLNITGHCVYDIFSNYIVLECSFFHTFTLFNWQTNQIHKSYLNLFEYLNKFKAKVESELQYDIQAVKIFAIQKLLTTKDDTFLNSQPSFEDWLQSLPFQYKSMMIFEDTWLFKYDRTAIIMIQESILVYDMNQNKIISQLELKIPYNQISFIWQASNKIIYITKEGQFIFYE